MKTPGQFSAKLNRLRIEGLAGLVRDLTAIAPDALRAAA
jgi:hypothetical protein